MAELSIKRETKDGYVTKQFIVSESIASQVEQMIMNLAKQEREHGVRT